MRIACRSIYRMNCAIANPSRNIVLGQSNGAIKPGATVKAHTPIIEKGDATEFWDDVNIPPVFARRLKTSLERI